jgi:hypothetical protein
MMIVWAINGFHAPINGNRFGFQRMGDKVKDRLVLSVLYFFPLSSLGQTSSKCPLFFPCVKRHLE